MVLVQELTEYYCDLDWHQYQVSLSCHLLLESRSTSVEDSTSFLQERDFLSTTSFRSFVSLQKSLSVLRLS